MAAAVDAVVEGPGEVGDFPAGEDRQVRDGLRAGGVVVEHYQDPGGRRGRGLQGFGDGPGGNPDLRREGGQHICFEKL